MSIINLNTTEYWPVWVGFSWFVILIGVRFQFNLGPVDFKPLTSANLYEQINTLFPIITYVVVILITLISVVCCHSALKIKFSVKSYCILFILTILSRFIGSWLILKSIGLGTSFWCIIIGCLFRNLFSFVSVHSLSLEFFIKTSIVLLAINLQDISTLGPRSVVIGWVETSLLLLCSFATGIYLFKLPKVKSIAISAGLSICGTSAIMALSDVIGLDTQDLNTFITIVSIFTVPLIPIMPIVCRYLNFSDTISGLWIGGTIDSTGAVIASARLMNTTAFNSAVILKMIQNILIGPVTLIVTLFWHQTFKANILWNKFPKFVLGFLVISCIVSAINMPVLVNDSFFLSEWFSHLSFVLIGLDIDLWTINNILKHQLPIIGLYLFGQTLDVFTTLGMSVLLF